MREGKTTATVEAGKRPANQPRLEEHRSNVSCHDAHTLQAAAGPSPTAAPPAGCCRSAPGLPGTSAGPAGRAAAQGPGGGEAWRGPGRSGACHAGVPCRRTKPCWLSPFQPLGQAPQRPLYTHLGQVACSSHSFSRGQHHYQSQGFPQVQPTSVRWQPSSRSLSRCGGSRGAPSAAAALCPCRPGLPCEMAKASGFLVDRKRRSCRAQKRSAIASVQCKAGSKPQQKQHKRQHTD